MKTLIFVFGQAISFNIILPLWYGLIKLKEVIFNG